MDITSVPVVAVEILPTQRAPRRWRPGQSAAASTREAARVKSAEGLETDTLEADGVEANGVEAAAITALFEDPAPLASFGRWLADMDEIPPAPPAEATAVAVTADPAADADASPEADNERLRGLAQEVKDLSEELETVRQRAAAERMRLLEDLSAAREARHLAEQELAAMQAVLDVAERQLPRPRGYAGATG
jgi:hypothetical protein